MKFDDWWAGYKARVTTAGELEMAAAWEAWRTVEIGQEKTLVTKQMLEVLSIHPRNHWGYDFELLCYRIPNEEWDHIKRKKEKDPHA